MLVRRFVRRYVEEDRLYSLLLSLVILLALQPLMLELGRLNVYRLIFAAQLVLAVYSLSATRKTLVLSLIFGIPAVVTAVTVYSRPSIVWLLISAGSAVVFLIYAIAVVFRQVLRPGRISGDRIAGAISVYLLLGLLWSVAYGIIGALDPEAFRGIEVLTLDEALERGSEHGFLYFSFVTLTTLGFGDITPVSPLPRTLAWAEAVTGQLFVAVTIARLVALQIAHSARGRTSSDD